MREQFHTEWERAVKNKMMWIAVFIGCLLAIAQTVFEVYPYARNPLSKTSADFWHTDKLQIPSVLWQADSL